MATTLLRSGGGLVLVLLLQSLGTAQEAALPDDAELRPWLGPQDWRRASYGPVLSLGKPGAFDDQHIHGPCTAWINHSWYLWYTGARGSVEDRVSRMGMAFSADHATFMRWSHKPLLELGGNRSLMTPTVLTHLDGTPIRESGKLRFWFSATDFKDPQQRHTLHEVTSTDGIQFDQPSPPQLENCYAPTFVKDGDRYLLWYTDVGRDPWCFRHAVSNDGRNWKVTPEPVLEISQPWEQGRLFYPTVRQVDGLFVMWYGSYWSEHKNKTALGFAVSRDGAKWTKSPHNPVFKPDPSRAWESHYTTNQSIVREKDGTWRIWYASRTKPPFTSKYFAIGTAKWSGPTPEK